MSLRVLIATHRMGRRSGSEVHSRDLAMGLVARGHSCAVLATHLHEDADTRGLRQAGVALAGRLGDLPWEPDCIHGHHRAETILAASAFPRSPALQVCHDATNRRDAAAPPELVQLWCAVDEHCRERVARETGLPASAIPLLRNAVDLSSFPARTRPPETPPRRAALFHSSPADLAALGPIREACSARGIEVGRMGPGAFVPEPSAALAGLDLVFAKARCALEAMAAGCHVILVGADGIGPAVTPAGFDALRNRNFGRSLLREPLASETLGARIDILDRGTTDAVAAKTRESCDIGQLAAEAEALHRRILATPFRRPAAARLAHGLPAWMGCAARGLRGALFQRRA